MRLLTTLTALALAASAALAQTAGFCVVKSPGNYETVTAGSRYTVRWEPGAIVSAGAADAQITISLLGGDSPGTLQHLGWIQTVSARAGTFDWPVDRALGGHSVYGLEMRSVDDSATFQYSFPFHIAAAKAAPEPPKPTMAEQPKSAPKTTPKPAAPPKTTPKPAAPPKTTPKPAAKTTQQKAPAATKTTLTTLRKTQQQQQQKPTPTPTPAPAVKNKQVQPQPQPQALPKQEDKKITTPAPTPTPTPTPTKRPGWIF